MEEFEAVLETGGAAAAELAAAGLAARGGRCANCRAPLIGPFCAACGQPADVHRRSVGHLTKELIKDVASFDSRLLRTAKSLLLRPGELATAFREGRTQRFVPPVRLYLFVSLIFFLVLSFSGIAIFQFVVTATPGKITVEHGHVYMTVGGEKQEMSRRYADGRTHYNFTSRIVFFARTGTLHSELTPDAKARLDEGMRRIVEKTKKDKNAGFVARTVTTSMAQLAQDPAALNGALTAWIPRALFLLLPLFALLLAAFYWRQRKSLYFVDHLVFSLGFHSFGFALLLVAAGLAQIVPGEVVAWLTLATLGVYLLVAMKRFYGQNWYWTVGKIVAVGTLYTVFFVLPAFGGVIAAAVLWG